MSNDVIQVRVRQDSAAYLHIETRAAHVAVGRASNGENAPDAFRAGELILGALGACTAGTIRHFAQTHGISQLQDVTVDVTGYESSAPSRIGAIVVRVTLHGPLAAHDRVRLEKAARQFKIHHTLQHPPEIELAFEHHAAPIVAHPEELAA